MPDPRPLDAKNALDALISRRNKRRIGYGEDIVDD
jgi:hypothetical protein